MIASDGVWSVGTTLTVTVVEAAVEESMSAAAAPLEFSAPLYEFAAISASDSASCDGNENETGVQLIGRVSASFTATAAAGRVNSQTNEVKNAGIGISRQVS